LDGRSDIRPLAGLAQLPLGDGEAADIVAYILEDPQMRNWPEARREAIPQLGNCRTWVGQLEASDLGYGRLVLTGLRGIIVSLLPGDNADRILRATDPIWNVARGDVYVVTRDCALAARSLQGS
jgi:hypothetical protein